MLRSTIHLTTCRGRRILVIYYVKFDRIPTADFAFYIKKARQQMDSLFLQLAGSFSAPIALRHCVTTVLPIDTAICMFYRTIIVYFISFVNNFIEKSPIKIQLLL